MAKKKSEGLVPVRVLVAGMYDGIEAKVDDVLELSEEIVEAHVGAVDASPEAVAYAKSLKE